jgi:hypothetical protein
MRSSILHSLGFGFVIAALTFAFTAFPARAASHKAHTVAQPMACAQEEETLAFALRHLQSRLMVAGLSCNQSDAYNTFVQHFTSELSDSGARLVAYFQRTGGGSAALNRHVTDLANGAGRVRATDPQGFCQGTWQVFWALEQEPEKLLQIAFDNLVEKVNLPPSCPGTRSTGTQEANAPAQ